MRGTLAALAFLVAGATFALPARATEPAEAEASAHGGEAEHDEHAAPPDINWFDGFLGEKKDVPPSLLWRTPGTAPPFAATVVNAGVLFYVLYRFGKKPILEGLRARKKSILQGMDEAARMRTEAERRLAEYEAKLAGIDTEIERVHREMKEHGEAERERIVADARERRLRMERDARLLIEQELKAAREQVMKETVASAVSSAEEALKRAVSVSDQQRLADEYLAAAGSSFARGLGGRA